MKARILLLMLMLGFLDCISTTQPKFKPQMLDNGFLLAPNSHNFDIKITKSGKRSKPSNSTYYRGNTSRDTHLVDFALNFDVDTELVSFDLIDNDGNIISCYDLDVYSLESGSNIVSIPENTYDIIFSFRNLTWWSCKFVIFEQVIINQDLQLNISSSDAKNHIHFQTLNNNGEPVRTDKYSADEDGNLTLIEEGNIDDVIFDNWIVSPQGQLINNSGDFGYIIEGSYNFNGADLYSDFYVNDVSERFGFTSSRFGWKGHEFFTAHHEVCGVSGDTTIANDPSKYVLCEEPFDISERQDNDLYPSFTYIPRHEGEWIYSNYTTILTTPLAQDEMCRYYLGASVNDSPLGYVPFSRPQVSIKTDENEEEEYTPIFMSIPLVLFDGKIVQANNGIGSYFDDSSISFNHSYSEELNADEEDVQSLPFWPTNPAFTYTLNKRLEKLGNNCPILVSNPLQLSGTYSYEDEDGNEVIVSYNDLAFEYDYIGRYGERRPEDRHNAYYSIRLNGEEFMAGNGTLYESLDESLNGIVDATIVKEGIVVDDIEGSNRALLHYTAGAEDENPPTVTMLHFKDADDNVTDRLPNATEGNIELCAGDFNHTKTPLGFSVYDRFAPKSVEVSYSPYGEDNWNELAVEEVPENYWPTMGWFYTGSLASVTGQGLNGWFDLKIRLTDAAGNWQEQVISPAFRVDDLAYSSVASVGSSNAHEVARYNLAGQRVDGNATGVVIIKMSDGTARKVLVK